MDGGEQMVWDPVGPCDDFGFDSGLVEMKRVLSSVPIAAVTNDHELNSLKQPKLILL